MKELIPTSAGEVIVGEDSPRSAMFAILDERARQNDIWGRQRHAWPEWMSILSEEVGEAAREANQTHWGNGASRGQRDEMLANLRRELVQTAAVCVQIIEHIDEELAGGGDQ